MRVFLTVTEYASIHPDGTYTAVRAGMRGWLADQDDAANLRLFVLVEVSQKAEEYGDHLLQVTLRDGAGALVFEPFEQEFTTKPQAGTFRETWEINGAIGPGLYRLEASLDGQVRDSLELVVEPMDDEEGELWRPPGTRRT